MRQEEGRGAPRCIIVIEANGRRQPREIRPSRRVVAIACALALAVWGGCSVEKNYKVLSFFFDGVPNPNEGGSQAGARPAGGGAFVAGTMVSAHTAYLDHRCVQCHGDQAQFGFATSGFSNLDELICVTCHYQLLEGMAFTHGPVAAGMCLTCHDPHASPYPALLKETGPALCVKCHDLAASEDPIIPEHEDLGRNCLDCHYGHGGELPYLLKSSAWTARAGPDETPGTAEPET